ncbi:CrcB family protein [Pilimelia columellifera]|uniref:Fluoride-specific ion channel FluC n=1 Tax=Pilimelia columellifera subsp. columellifera TaxID=706583 RepID=A0ABP6AAM3_9ACTN
MTRPPLALVVAVAAGGAVGALARYGVSVAAPGPWGTLGVNVAGCLAIGGLLQWLADHPTSSWSHRLARPALGVGLLGGFTTFSTYAVESVALARSGQAPAAVAHLLGTAVAAVVAVWAGAALARAGRP